MGKDVTSDHILDSLRLAVKDIIDKQSEPLVLQPRLEIRPYPPHPGPAQGAGEYLGKLVGYRITGRPHKNYLIEE